MRQITKTFTLISCFIALFSCASCTKDNTSNQNTSDEVTIIGSWKYSFSSGYVILTFDNDGYMRYYEYDHGAVESDKYYQYTYDNNILTLKREGHSDKVIEVETLSREKLVLRDWPDGGLCVFVRQ